MQVVTIILEIIKFVIPALIVFATVWIILKKYLDNEQRKRLYEIKISNQRTALPLRLQAYERLTLLLERLSVNNLIVRVKKQGMSSADLQAALLFEIRSEFDHNLAQQIYVSQDVWNQIKIAKEDLIKSINIAYASLGPDGTAMDLTKVIFDIYMKQEYPATFKALLYLKKEVTELF